MCCSKARKPSPSTRIGKFSRASRSFPRGGWSSPNKPSRTISFSAPTRDGAATARAVLEEFDQLLTLFPQLKGRFRQRAGSLSGGEQQMLVLARGLLSKPTLLMIDEMSLGLAPKVLEQMMTQLQELNAKGQTILLVEQLASHALAIAHRAYVVEHGRIELHGPAATLAGSPAVMEAFLGKKRKSA